MLKKILQQIAKEALKPHKHKSYSSSDYKRHSSHHHHSHGHHHYKKKHKSGSFLSSFFSS